MKEPKASISPFIQLEEETEEDSKLLEKQIKSIKQSKILKDYIRDNRCSFVSEDLLREDPVRAFQAATNATKPPSFFYKEAAEEEVVMPPQRSESNIEFFSDDYLANVPRNAHLQSFKDPRQILIENIVADSVIKNRRILGMILGTVIVAAASSIASGGVAVIIVSSLVGFGIGGICGSFIRKKYKDEESQLTELERASFRVIIMMANFNEIRSKYEKDLVILLLQKIMREGKTLRELSKDGKNSVIEKIKNFVLTGEVSVLLEEGMDIFDLMCKSPKDNQIPAIMEAVFNLYIPLVEIIRPKKGEHCSLYKRVIMSLYDKNTMKIIKSTTITGKACKSALIHGYIKDFNYINKDTDISIEADNAFIDEEVLSIVLPGLKLDRKLSVNSNSPKNTKGGKNAGENADNMNDSGEDLIKSKPSLIVKPKEESKEIQILIETPQAPVVKKKSTCEETKKKTLVKKKSTMRKVNPEINKLLDAIKEPTSGQGWSLAINEKNITFYKKTSNNTPLVLVKGMAMVEGVPLEIMWKAIADIKLRAKWDNLFQAFELLDTNPDGTETVYLQMKTPFPVSTRDFVHKKTLLFDYPTKGQVTLHFVSTEHPSKPPKSSPVRGQTIVSGYLIKEMSKFPLRCSIHIVTQVDMKGNIPMSMINMFAAGGSRDWVESYRKGCADIMKTMKK